MTKTQKAARPPRQTLKTVDVPRDHPYLTKIAAFVGRLEGAAYTVQRSRRHLVVVVTHQGKSHYQTVPATPSDWRGPDRAVTDIRHGLGLVGATPQKTAPAREGDARRRKWGKPGLPVRPAHMPWPKRAADSPKETEDRFRGRLQALLVRMQADEAAAAAVAQAAAAALVATPRAEARIRLRTPFFGKRSFFQTMEI